MDKYKFLSTTPFRRLLYRQDAIALLYVMIAVLFTAAISTMLMKLSHYDVTASKDMSSMTTAAISARAALDGFEALAAASPNRILDTLNRFLKGTSQGWLFDSAMTKATLSDQQRFTTRIINFDKTNMVARIEGIGYGKGGSSKKVIGVYKLGNVAFPPATSIGKNVLFINGDISFDSRLIIKGGVYCKADKFDLSSSWNTGSEFYGPVIIKGNAELRGTYTFKDIVLCKGTFDIVPDGTFQLTFEKKSAFGGNFNELYLSSETITMKENTYINGILSTLINNLSGKQFHYNSGIMTNPAEVQAKLTNCSSIQPNGNPFNVSQAAGIPDSCPSPIFNIDSIPSANIFLWSALKNTGSGTGIVKYRVKSPPVTVGQEFCAYTAVLANAIYDTIKKRGKLWRGFAVVNVDAALYPFVSTDSTDRTFLRKIILINNSTIDYVGGGIPGFPNHHDTAATVIYNKNNFNMTQNFSHYPSKDLFRGYLFNPPTISSSNLFQVAASTSGLYNFRGAVHNMRPDNSATDDWHPDDTKNVTTLVYDSLLMQNLHDIHLVKNIDPRAAAGSTDSLVLADPLKKIELTNYGVGY